MDAAALAYNLLTLRVSKGFKTAAALAEASGVSAATISRYDSGQRKQPSDPHLRKLATALGVGVDRLMQPIPANDDPVKNAWPELAISPDDDLKYRVAQLEQEMKSVRGVPKDAPEPKHDAVQMDLGGAGEADPAKGGAMSHGDADLFALEVRSDALAPDLLHGHMLKMSRAAVPAVGDVVFIVIAGERRLMRVVSIDDGLCLTSARGDLHIGPDDPAPEGVMVAGPYRL